MTVTLIIDGKKLSHQQLEEELRNAAQIPTDVKGRGKKNGRHICRRKHSIQIEYKPDCVPTLKIGRTEVAGFDSVQKKIITLAT